jgi:hypothetical protein
MASYSLGVRTSVVATGAAPVEVFTAATINCSILAIMVTNAAAVSQTIGLGRPAAQGITPAGSILGLENGLTGGLTQVATSWGTGPTIPARFLRRSTLAPTIGAGVVWTFLRGLVIPLSASIVMWNLSVGSPLDVTIILDE